MDDNSILSHLEGLAHILEIEIRYEPLESETTFKSGGLCRVRDKRFIIVNEKASTREKVQIIAKALRRFDLSRVYLKPALRDLLENDSEEGHI